MVLSPTSFWVMQKYFPDTLASPISKVLTVYRVGQRDTFIAVLKLLQFIQVNSPVYD